MSWPVSSCSDSMTCPYRLRGSARSHAARVGGPAHLFPPFFLILARQSFFLGTKKQTDAESGFSAFFDTMRIPPLLRFYD
jgi:hypothetical protein